MSAHDVIVRDAIVDDAADVMRIYNQEVLEGWATLDATPRTIDDQARWIEDRSGAHVVLVAEIDGAVAGFASLSSFRDRAAYRPTVENSVYVDPSFHRRGIGRALLAELIDRARQHGFHSIIARVAGENPGSIALHQRLGYDIVGVEREVGRKFGRWLDITELQLML